MKKIKIYCMILALIVIVPNLTGFSYAKNNVKVMDLEINELRKNVRVIDLEIDELDNITEFNYTKIENGEILFYEETLSNNNIYTKIFKNNILIDEFNTTIIVSNSGKISAEIMNVKSFLTEVISIGQLNGDSLPESMGTYAIVPPNRTRHPLDMEYYLAYGTGGHLGVRNLTLAAIVGVIAAVGTGGNIIAGSATAVGILILEGGYRDVWYDMDSFHPYGTDMIGRPIWKKVQKLYSGNDRRRQIGATLYYDSDLTVVR